MTTFFLLFLAVLGGAVVLISWRPDEFHVTRTAKINAAPDAVFPHINNLHAWDAWSPWAKLDPNAVNSFDGPDQGVGSSMSWKGNNQVGVGTMTITESVPGERVRMRLDFKKPMEGESNVEFRLTPDGAGTAVVWSMNGRNNFIGKAMDLYFNCDKMVGGQYEKGLANLKAVVEGGAAEPDAAEPGAAS